VNPDPPVSARLNRFDRNWHPGVSHGSTASFERAHSPRDDVPCQQARQALFELESANCQVLCISCDVGMIGNPLNSHPVTANLKLQAQLAFAQRELARQEQV